MGSVERMKFPCKGEGRYERVLKPLAPLLSVLQFEAQDKLFNLPELHFFSSLKWEYDTKYYTLLLGDNDYKVHNVIFIM